MSEQLLVAILGLAVTIVGMLGGTLYWLGGKFKEIEMRFREVDRRFDEVYRKFDEVNSRIGRLAGAFVNYQEFFIEFLASEGVLKAEKAVLARGELLRFVRLAMQNPFTKEELRRLEELILKDELTLEETLELRELARKAINEYWQYPEAWKLHMYACIMVGLALRREMEKRKEGEGSGR